MANKPTETPDWVGTQSPATAGKKAAGYSPSERPGAQLFNWFWALISSWVLYLKDGIFRNSGSDASDVTISAGFADTDGNVRHFFDSMGILGGMVCRKEFNFAFPHKTQDEEKSLNVPTATWRVDGDTNNFEFNTSPISLFGSYWFNNSALLSGDVLDIPIPLEEGQRLRRVEIEIDIESGILGLELISQDRSVSRTDGTSIASGVTAGTGVQTITLAPSSPELLGEDDELSVRLFEDTAISANDVFIYQAKVFYDDGILDVPFGGSGLLYSRSESNVNVSTRAPGSNYPVAFGRINVLDAAVNEGASIHTLADVFGTDTRTVFPTDDSIIVMEFGMRMSAIGANEVRIFGGLHADADLVQDVDYANPATYNFIGFRKNSTETEWRAIGTDSSGLVVNTMVAPVANVFQTFRIEVHGDNTPLGVLNGSQTIRYYIDGTLEREQIMNTPLATALSLAFHVEANATGPSADLQFDITPFALSVVPEFGGYELTT